MGLLKKIGDAGKKLSQVSGGVDAELMENGLLGLGTIAEIDEKHLTVSLGGGNEDDRTCAFTVDVALDNTAPFQATCTQRVSSAVFDALQPGRGFVAVRVDPDDHSRIALDTRTDPPVVTLPAAQPGQLTTYDILEQGVPVQVKLAASRFMRMRNAQGVDMYATKFTVLADGRSWEVQLNQPVPAEGVPLLVEGAELPGKMLAGNDQAVVIDWPAATSSA